MWDARSSAFLCCNNNCSVAFLAASLPPWMFSEIRLDYIPGSAEKIQDWLNAGTRLVWEVNPRRRTVTVYTGERQSTRLTAADALDGGDVLPGFSCRVADVFA